MPESKSKLTTLSIVAIVAPLFVFLIAAGWYASRAFTASNGPPMPDAGYVAMTLGIVFSLLVGCGLMALVFYSSRYGYDERAQTKDDVSDSH